MILCDIGNTTFDFLINNKLYKIPTHQEINLNINQPIYFISVNQNATNKLLTKYPNSIDLKPYLNIDSNYCTNLGVDRIALIYTLSDNIVVDCGSAISVDIVQNNIHLGGFLLPGISKLSQLYPNISSKLSFEIDNKINLDKLPLCTNDAINYGLFSMIVEPIKLLQSKYNLPLLFTGGDGEMIANFLGATYQKNLIFQHLKVAIKENFDIIHKTNQKEQIC